MWLFNQVLFIIWLYAQDLFITLFSYSRFYTLLGFIFQILDLTQGIPLLPMECNIFHHHLTMAITLHRLDLYIIHHHSDHEAIAIDPMVRYIIIHHLDIRDIDIRHLHIPDIVIRHLHIRDIVIRHLHIRDIVIRDIVIRHLYIIYIPICNIVIRKVDQILALITPECQIANDSFRRTIWTAMTFFVVWTTATRSLTCEGTICLYMYNNY